MKKTLILSILLFSFFSIAFDANSGVNEKAVAKVIAQFRPDKAGFKPIIVNRVTINSSRRTVTIACSEEAAYIPFTADRLKELKAAILSRLGAQYKNYKVTITAKGKNLDKLVLFESGSPTAPKEKHPFIVNHSAEPAPKGLEGANIALWQSHGWYFEPTLNRWEWQRARVMQTVEDLYTQSYVMPFLMPMLQNAGAYVLSPRERDTNLTEIIIDADNSATSGYSEKNGSKKWKSTSKPGFGWNGEPLIDHQNPFLSGSSRMVETIDENNGDDLSKAIWKADIPQNGTYAVYVSYASMPNSSTAANYTVYSADGPRRFTINQQMGGGTWIYLGHFPLEAGKGRTIVTLDNSGEKKGEVVTADAVKIGGGMGLVARRATSAPDSIGNEYILSGYPKFTEGARYFLQWAGAPDSVFSPSEYVSDYIDDYRCRGLWVNWLAGGSSQLPDSAGLGIPIDLSFAFHSDAGTFKTDSIVGTLGIYCTDGDVLGNGDSRLASRDLTDLVMTSITNDIRATFEPSWTRRGMWDKKYHEARAPMVPSMLLELLSHQNFFDMQYGLDPAFRFLVSRAIYKGILQFLAHRDGRKYVVQPLPVKNFAIDRINPRHYKLRWEETVDSLESSATPKYYIIEERIGSSGFYHFLDKIEKTEYELKINDNEIHTYRVIAGNDGGISFPSENLSLCDLGNGREVVLVVNGFTRVSAPDRFEFSEDYAGFYDERDHGVPFIEDISYIGSQFEFRRDIPWMDDDAAGFGASRANYEKEVIAGNTFDYPYIHGEAIVAAGHSFYSTSVGAYQNTDASKDPKIVDLILGKQKEIKQGRGYYGTRFKTFPSELQDKIKLAADRGTSFFISGAFVATDLWDNPNSSPAVAEADHKFASQVLGYNWRVGQASITGEAYQVQCPFSSFKKGVYNFYNELNGECYAVESPDSFYPSDDKRGFTFLRYSENNLIAGTATRFDNYDTVVIGFPFETIKTSKARTSLMSQILNFFTTR